VLRRAVSRPCTVAAQPTRGLDVGTERRIAEVKP
jgi:ABC-type uncharacterized transport system ATPase subunit